MGWWGITFSACCLENLASSGSNGFIIPHTLSLQAVPWRMKEWMKEILCSSSTVRKPFYAWSPGVLNIHLVQVTTGTRYFSNWKTKIQKINTTKQPAKNLRELRCNGNADVPEKCSPALIQAHPFFSTFFFLLLHAWSLNFQSSSYVGGLRGVRGRTMVDIDKHA